ncbi:hypothetical protein SLEP1_g48346 [Rubroshorea leprosula]|uniref:DNA topoisomerase (ATP-hydrolyzing) n=1 Tax=Rubroshorea leprosula TaxID=152421 RepID=A0AAV5LU85_9ROSI|nr:hypothetical protein SLEP1_g48346 [Rubroshorea leprosula]
MSSSITNEAFQETSSSSKAYGSEQIQVPEGLDPVRKRPGMCIGGTGPRGLHHLVYEILDNAIDEAQAGYATHMDVILHPDGSIPTDLHPVTKKSSLETVLTVLHAGGKFGGSSSGYGVFGGLHGVGLSVVNALSEFIYIDSKCFTNLDNLPKFVAYVVHHRYPNNILGLSVCAHRGILGDDLLDRIMNFVISHGEMLDLSFGGSRNCLLLPQRIFNCQSLRVLKLSHFGNNGVPNSIGLASVKTLTLCDITLDNKSHCFDHFSSCMNLENIVLDDVLVVFSTVFNIITPRLVNSAMSNVKYFIASEPDEWDFASIDKLKVVISALRLTSFSFTCDGPVLLSMDNSPILEK